MLANLRPTIASALQQAPVQNTGATATFEPTATRVRVSSNPSVSVRGTEQEAPCSPDSQTDCMQKSFKSPLVCISLQELGVEKANAQMQIALAAAYPALSLHFSVLIWEDVQLAPVFQGANQSPACLLPSQ